jgi:hypothetical protein
LNLLNAMHVTYSGMHWVAAAIAFCGVAILAVCAPFPRWLRLALPFTFFFAYQYAVVARSYVMLPLLAFGAAALWNKRPVWVAVSLGLMANTSMHGLALAAGLAFVYAVETFQGRHRERGYWLPLLIFLALASAAVLTVVPPPPDLTFGSEVFHLPLSERIALIPAMGLVYLLRAASLSWPLSFLIVPAAYWVTARAAGLLYLAPVAAVAIFSGCFFNFWHLGFAMIAVIVTAWITWKPAPDGGLRWLAITTAVLWLGIQILYTVHALSWGWDHPYSPDAETARYLSPIVAKGGRIAVEEANRNVVGAFHSIGLSPYFQRSIFANQPSPYWRWNQNREQMDAAFDEVMRTHPDAVVAVFFTRRGQRFNPEYDLESKQLRTLYLDGYAVRQVFCGEKPEGLSFREEICHIILEPVATEQDSALHGR